MMKIKAVSDILTHQVSVTLGVLIYQILPLFSSFKSKSYETLQIVFEQQFIVDQNKIVITRDKEDISAKSIQSPHDTDCNYRNKGGNKIKGYTTNVIESCDESGLNLIGNVNVDVASAVDVSFLQDGIEKVEAVFTDKTENVHADGAYHSPDNQSYCQENFINLYLHAIQGAKGRYAFTQMDNGELIILDTNTNQTIIAKKILSKKNVQKWRIDTNNGYRYITQKEIDAYFLRKQIEEIPIEILQKRNNVEATIFQLGYHYPNDKSRYRGLIKHKMWANIRCLWINFVRILKHIRQLCQKDTFLSKTRLFHLVKKLKFVIDNYSWCYCRYISRYYYSKYFSCG